MRSGATGPSGHGRLRVHAVNRKQGAQLDGHGVGPVDHAPSCEFGDCGTAAAWLSGTCFLVRAVGRATATAAGFDRVFCDSHARARPGSVTLAAVSPGTFSADQARDIGERIGIDWKTARFDVEQFRMGLDVELEHGRRDPATNVSDNDEVTTGKIAWAHLNEFPDYYTRLAQMEAEADRYWSARDQDSAV